MTNIIPYTCQDIKREAQIFPKTGHASRRNFSVRKNVFRMDCFLNAQDVKIASVPLRCGKGN